MEQTLFAPATVPDSLRRFMPRLRRNLRKSKICSARSCRAIILSSIGSSNTVFTWAGSVAPGLGAAFRHGRRESP